MSLEILGMNELLKKLSLMGGNEAIMKGIEKGALRVEADAKRNLTSNQSVDTGLLRASIDHKLNTGTLSATVGSNVEYSKFVEFGTITNRAKPYLYPALQSNQDNISANVMEAIRDSIRRL